MKSHLRTAFVISILFTGAFASISCQTEDHVPFAKEPQLLEENLLESSELFSTLVKSRLTDHAFVIEDIQRFDNFLSVEVTGGGSKSSFQFIWDGKIQESSPEGIQLVLIYDNENNDFEKDKELELTVNLQKIVGNGRDPANFYFSILNGSQNQRAVLDPDGTVSNK